MQTHAVRLLDRKVIAEGTMAFYFERPKRFAFQAGQSITIQLPAHPGAGVRRFSLASAPHETPLMIATRLRNSEFKQVLSKQPRGARLEISGPAGTFLLPEPNRGPIVFVAGGIGITPFRSMLVHLTTIERSPEIMLIYSNRRPEDAAFLGELQRLEQHLGNFTLVATMTQKHLSRRNWEGETLRVDEVLLYRYVRNMDGSVFYVAGPPRMVSAVRYALRQAGVEKQRAHREAFSGY